MYYVIQHNRDNPKKHFVAYKALRFITAKSNDNVIFEFNVEGKIKRKWTAKSEIILVTDKQELFEKVLKQLTAVQEAHLKEVHQAEESLKKAFIEMASSMQQEFESLNEERQDDDSDFECLLEPYR